MNNVGESFLGVDNQKKINDDLLGHGEQEDAQKAMLGWKAEFICMLTNGQSVIGISKAFSSAHITAAQKRRKIRFLHMNEELKLKFVAVLMPSKTSLAPTNGTVQTNDNESEPPNPGSRQRRSPRAAKPKTIAKAIPEPQPKGRTTAKRTPAPAKPLASKAQRKAASQRGAQRPARGIAKPAFKKRTRFFIPNDDLSDDD
eukprot:2904211-Pleurochrysis_carterae.AAC.1